MLKHMWKNPKWVLEELGVSGRGGGCGPPRAGGRLLILTPRSALCTGVKSGLSPDPDLGESLIGVGRLPRAPVSRAGPMGSKASELLAHWAMGPPARLPAQTPG